MPTYADSIADLAVNLRFESIPSEVIAKAKLHLLDSIGVGFAATTEPFAQSVVKTVEELDGRPESSILAAETLLSQEYAACANGTLIHGIDFDDTHIPGIVHPSACVVPAVLACGEARKISGKEALEAQVLGYEVVTRIGMAANGQFHDRGLHATPFCGTFAAAIVAGKIRGLARQELVNAMGICGSQGGGIQQFLVDGTWVKKLHPGWAAHSGIVASLLASRGFTGPSEVFEGDLGFFSAYLGLENCRLNSLTEGLGTVWETLRIQVKPYPSCHFTHSFMDCVLALKEEYNIQWQDIKRIDCRISPRGALIICEPIEKRRRVTTPYGGRFSLPYTVAVALVEGKVGLEQFSEECLNDERIIALASRVDYTKDERLSQEVAHFPGDVTIEMTNGKIYHRTQRFERGSPENPIAKDEVKNKFTANLAHAGIRDRNRIQDILRAIENLEQVTSIGELTALLR